MKRWPLLILALALGATTASAEEASEEAAEEAVKQAVKEAADESEEASERVCVNKRSINSFDAIDDQHIYIKATGTKYYLFTMQRKCFGLRDAYGIGIKDTMSRVCSGGFGEVVYRDRGKRRQSCRIDTIEAVASKDDAKGLVADRNAAKKEEKANN